VRWVGRVPAGGAAGFRGAGEYHLVVYPSAALYDGRGANKPWLQELPDPTTKLTWDSWVELHPETAKRLGVGDGDVVKLECEGRALELPVVVYGGIRPDTVAIPLGQGHKAFGRYARGRGANALDLLPATFDADSGALAYLSARVTVARTGRRRPLASAQRARGEPPPTHVVAEIVPLSALTGATGAGGAEGAAAAGHRGIDRNLPAHAVSAFVAPHEVPGPRNLPTRAGEYGSSKHRWAMAIDLASCIGCSACVVACRAENNVPAVGSERISRGRDMDWIRIDRFERFEGDRPDVRFLPMLCQHCTMAPCESVCPVYATYHNPEGLNAQVYNRCIGTRYCANNCPYKVRAFNWYDYSDPSTGSYAFPAPLNWQLNPDVTVRSKGVMEKCTFCIQRILDGKGRARDENRDFRDGDVVTACQQSCPTEAIVFGDLMDPASRVSKLSENDRRYWVLPDLNTKPGITYLKKVTRETA
jgi:molybdopterin-containing oxidoreductase family iron-sulfur binding subunit